MRFGMSTSCERDRDVPVRKDIQKKKRAGRILPQRVSFPRPNVLTTTLTTYVILFNTIQSLLASVSLFAFLFVWFLEMVLGVASYGSATFVILLYMIMQGLVDEVSTNVALS